MIKMKNKFCPRCGKETSELVEGLCEECFQKKSEIFVVPKKLEMNVCKHCGRYKEGGSWKEGKLDNVLQNLAKDSLTTERNLASKKIEIKKGTDYKIEITGTDKETGLEEKKKIEVDINYGTCDICAKISSGYFTTTLQIRGPEEKLERALEICEKTFDRKGNPEDFISDVRDVKNGYDLYMSSNSLARKMVSRLRNKFKIEKKSSKTLYGERDGQRIYRSTYLARILPEE